MDFGLTFLNFDSNCFFIESLIFPPQDKMTVGRNFFITCMIVMFNILYLHHCDVWFLFVLVTCQS